MYIVSRYRFMSGHVYLTWQSHKIGLFSSHDFIIPLFYSGGNLHISRSLYKALLKRRFAVRFLSTSISYSTPIFCALHLMWPHCFSFAIPSHSSKAGELTAILCGGQLSERWMDRDALCVFEWPEINSSRDCVQYDASTTSRILLQRHIIIFVLTSLEVPCFQSKKRNLFDQDNRRKRRELTCAL